MPSDKQEPQEIFKYRIWAFDQSKWPTFVVAFRQEFEAISSDKKKEVFFRLLFTARFYRKELA